MGGARGSIAIRPQANIPQTARPARERNAAGPAVGSSFNDQDVEGDVRWHLRFVLEVDGPLVLGQVVPDTEVFIEVSGCGRVIVRNQEKRAGIAIAKRVIDIGAVGKEVVGGRSNALVVCLRFYHERNAV